MALIAMRTRSCLEIDVEEEQMSSKDKKSCGENKRTKTDNDMEVDNYVLRGSVVIAQGFCTCLENRNIFRYALELFDLF